MPLTVANQLDSASTNEGLTTGDEADQHDIYPVSDGVVTVRSAVLVDEGRIHAGVQ